MVTSYQRGHLITFDFLRLIWVYADNNEPAEKERPCKNCGCPPTAKGHDACIADLPDVKHACCGHGVEKAYRINK